MGLAAALALLIAALAFAVYCVGDVVNAEEVRYLPRWLWAFICIVSIPIGGIAYPTLGRVR
jgi:hypothetical protein